MTEAEQYWESDGRIVPLKPVHPTGGSKRGNSRAGKAAKLTRDSVRPLTALRGGSPVLARLNRITYRALANVYLHYVLDQWFEREVKPRLRGEAHMVRYADDFICAFELEQDARRFQAVLHRRLARFSLELAEDKTKLLRFGRFSGRDSTRLSEGTPGTFDFLGFTHYCGRSRAGKFKLKRKTAKKKLRAKFQALKEWFRGNLTKPTAEIWPTFCAKLQGHFQYYNINDNWRWVMKYREAARRMGLRWMRRRSQNSRMNWATYNNYLRQHPLPNPTRIVDLLAKARQLAHNALKSRQIIWLFEI